MSKGSPVTTSKTPASSKTASQAGKAPARAAAAPEKAPAAKAPAPGASGKAKRKADEPPAAAPPAPPAAAPPLVRPELSAIALEASSRVKRQRVLDVIIPQSTSSRMAEAARASVWAISSEKTTIQFEAAEAAAEAAEVRRSEGLVADDAPALKEALRRSQRDLFAFMREELDRPEDDPRDPHGLWRRAHKRLRHELSPPPAPDELERLEGRLGAQLPPSYWDFSLEWGGGLLFVHEFGAIRLVPALELHGELRGPLCGRMVRPYLPVVDLGCGDYLALDMARESKTGEHPLVWWYGGEVKKKVADSFVAWLKRLVETQGQPFWWES